MPLFLTLKFKDTKSNARNAESSGKALQKSETKTAETI